MSDETEEEQLVEGGALPFTTCVVTIEPGCALPYEEAAWRDAIVFITSGDIELQCSSGAVQRFRGGHILWLANLPLKAVRNPGPGVARLVAISRRA